MSLVIIVEVLMGIHLTSFLSASCIKRIISVNGGGVVRTDNICEAPYLAR